MNQELYNEYYNQGFINGLEKRAEDNSMSNMLGVGAVGAGGVGAYAYKKTLDNAKARDYILRRSIGTTMIPSAIPFLAAKSVLTGSTGKKLGISLGNRFLANQGVLGVFPYINQAKKSLNTKNLLKGSLAGAGILGAGALLTRNKKD